MKVAIFDCNSGISGDMTVGAFLDAGFDFKLLEKELRKLKLSGYKLACKKVKRGLMVGTKFAVHLEDIKRKETSFREVVKKIDESKLDPRIKAISKKIFYKLAQAEAKIHGVRLGAVHFHEVGAVDSFIDIVSTAICLSELDIKKVFVRNINLGQGEIRSHGRETLPLPAPATLALLKNYPVKFSQLNHELVTPTGAAIISALAETDTDIPSVEIIDIGYGAGSENFKEKPNVLRLSIGRLNPQFKQERIMALETNLDDMKPLEFEVLYQKLFAVGALDVFVTPILMKKTRPAYKLTIFFSHDKKDQISRTVFSETTTLGVRFSELDRFLLDRKVVKVKTKYGKLPVKIGSLDSQNIIYSPEYEDCKKIALKRKIPFRQVYQEAKKAAEQEYG